MPGKHAPASPRSFYLSLARAGAILAVVAGVITGIALVAGGGGKKAPVHPSSSQAARPSGSATPTVTAAPIQVVVLNGAGRQGLASIVAARLTADGWTVKDIGNAPTSARTVIYVRGSASAAAEQLRRAEFRFMTLDAIVVAGPNDPGITQQAALTVVLGSDYPNVPSAPKTTTASASPSPT